MDWLKKAQDFQREGRSAEAIDAYHRFLEVEPRHAGAWADLGGLLMNLGRLDEASEACEKALSLEAAHPWGRTNLGCTRMKQGRLEEAEGLLRKVLAQVPHLIDARMALSECLIRKQDPEGALGNLAKVLEQEPDNLLAFDKVIHIHARRGDWGALGQEIDRRLRVVPDCPEARLERSFLSLLLGDMPLGWEQFEIRFRVPSQQVSITGPFDQPLWDGAPFPGKTLLLHWEQGFGDSLMFIRYASLAKTLGGEVVVLAQPVLAELMATCPGVDRVIAHGDSLPPFDLHLPLLSLPRVFQTRLDSIPAAVPYLDVPERVPNREWLARVLAASEGRMRIGYAWAGRPSHLNDRLRSLSPAFLAPLAGLPGVAWHSFQLPAVEDAPIPSVNLAPLLSNFSDTAYALSGMDLVITVDTALAHAAGALGIPTLLMLPFDPDWRWMLERSDSPWYPTMRIYRQPRPGDWDSVIQGILRDLTGSQP